MNTNEYDFDPTTDEEEEAAAERLVNTPRGMIKRYASKQLQVLVEGYNQQDSGKMLVVTAMCSTLRGNKRTYCIVRPGEDFGDGVVVGTVGQIRKHYGLD